LLYAQIQEIIKQVEELETNIRIHPSDSPFNVPIIVVQKMPHTQGTPQCCVGGNFCRLHQITVGDAISIPRIGEILDQLGRSRYYYKLYLDNGSQYSWEMARKLNFQ